MVATRCGVAQWRRYADSARAICSRSAMRARWTPTPASRPLRASPSHRVRGRPPRVSFINSYTTFSTWIFCFFQVFKLWLNECNLEYRRKYPNYSRFSDRGQRWQRIRASAGALSLYGGLHLWLSWRWPVAEPPWELSRNLSSVFAGQVTGIAVAARTIAHWRRSWSGCQLTW